MLLRMPAGRDCFGASRLAMTFTALLLFSLTSFAFAEDEVRVKTRAWPVQVTLGDEVRLVVQTDGPAGATFLPPSDKVSLSPFELKKIETGVLETSLGRAKQTFVFRLTIFDLGEQHVPPVVMRYRDALGHSGETVTQAVSVKVVPVKKRPTDKNDIRPIKGPVSMDLRKYRDIFLGLVAFLLKLFLVIKIILRRRRRQTIDPESLLAAHERAVRELERLQNGALLSEGRTKAYYSELVDILRRYLSRRYEFETMEFTTSELLRDLQARQFERLLIERIKQVLEPADLVKFAKSTPTNSLAMTLVQQIMSIVDETKVVIEAPVKGKGRRP